MRSGELSFGSPQLLYVTWKIPVFFQLVKEYSVHSPEYFAHSPEFPFANDRYSLRLSSTWGPSFDYFDIKLVNLTETIPRTDVSYEVGVKSSTGKEIDIHRRGTLRGESADVFFFLLKELEEKRDSNFPDGTVTVFCSVRLREPNTPVSPKYFGTSAEVFSNFMATSSPPDSRMRGELSLESPPFLQVTWKIPAFFQLAKQSGSSIESPEFPFADGRYFLGLSPFRICNNDGGKIQLVNLTDTVPGTDVSYEVVLESRSGKEIDLNRSVSSTGQVSFSLERSELEEKRDSYFPDGTLTVFCFVRLRDPSSAGFLKSGRAETSDEVEEQEELSGIAKLQSDYRQLLQKGAESDACLVVSGKEFRAHKNILRARSTVFEAMFSHETAEKESGRVVIKDLDSENFGDFLEYLYTGAVETGFSDDSVFWLYKAADKYDVLTLKSECVAYMRKNLSVDSFCDVLTLALRHQEEKLLQQAVRFFKENMARIIVTVKWQQFVIDNGTAANELFIKAVVPGEQ